MALAEERPLVSLVVAGTTGPAARHGLSKIRQALQERRVAFEEVGSLGAARGGNLVVVGVGGSGAVGNLSSSANAASPQGAEAVSIRQSRWQGRPAWLVSGGDDRGLMYGLLDVADRIGWAHDSLDPLSEVREADESPTVRERSLSIYTMQKEQFERRLHNEAYWARYLDLLARSRFNTFTLILGYETAGYMAPPYPYFFDVAGFPQVHAVGYSPEAQRRNLNALNRLVSMAHERGLDFVLAIWDHIFRGGVQGGAKVDPQMPLPYRVTGVTEDNLYAYSIAALTTLLQVLPNLDGLQFRMHDESGLQEGEMEAFWSHMFDVIREHGRGLRFDARAKGLPDRIIDLALEKGIRLRVTTKYWMEQMGLPFHPTHVHPKNQMDRRHGYADLLRYPQRYKMLWRLWNGGTARILLWGDPDYVRRFAASCHLYDGDGFDVNEPLATKMASHDHDRAPYDLLEPAYRYYDWEFERYWHFFQVFGRVGYNPDTPAEVWEREFPRRFGPEAGPCLCRALHLASRILPRIVAYNYPYDLFPTTRGWAEKQPMKTLPDYAAALPSDTEQFQSMADEARAVMEGSATGRIRPQATSAWFAQVSGEVLALAGEAEQRIGERRSAELASTLADLRILAHLAAYHAQRALAGASYALYTQSADLNALDEAIRRETQAIAAWEQIVKAAEGVYARNFMMGREHVGLAGSWVDELQVLRDGLRALQATRDAFAPDVAAGTVKIAHVPVRRAAPGVALSIRATVTAPGPLSRVQIRCWSVPGDEHVLPMSQDRAHTYQASIPGELVKQGLRYRLEASDARGALGAYPLADGGGSIAVVVNTDEWAPQIVHEPILSATAGQPLRVTARVTDPSGVGWARLHYRSVNQYLDFRTLEMVPGAAPDTYQATIPAADIDPAWDLMYFIEAVDACGNGCIWPDLETETPYVVVTLDRGPARDR